MSKRRTIYKKMAVISLSLSILLSSNLIQGINFIKLSNNAFAIDSTNTESNIDKLRKIIEKEDANNDEYSIDENIKSEMKAVLNDYNANNNEENEQKVIDVLFKYYKLKINKYFSNAEGFLREKNNEKLMFEGKNYNQNPVLRKYRNFVFDDIEKLKELASFIRNSAQELYSEEIQKDGIEEALYSNIENKENYNEDYNNLYKNTEILQKILEAANTNQALIKKYTTFRSHKKNIEKLITDSKAIFDNTETTVDVSGKVSESIKYIHSFYKNLINNYASNYINKFFTEKRNAIKNIKEKILNSDVYKRDELIQNENIRIDNDNISKPEGEKEAHKKITTTDIKHIEKYFEVTKDNVRLLKDKYTEDIHINPEYRDVTSEEDDSKDNQQPPENTDGPDDTSSNEAENNNGFGDYANREILINAFKESSKYKENGDNSAIITRLKEILQGEIDKAKLVKPSDGKLEEVYNDLQETIDTAKRKIEIINSDQSNNINDIKKIKSLVEEIIRLQARVLEYNSSQETSDEDILNKLREKDPDIVILEKGKIIGTGAIGVDYPEDEAEQHKFPMLDGPLRKPFKIFKTNKGYKVVVGFKGLRRPFTPNPNDPLTIGFYKAYLSGMKVVNKENMTEENISPISKYDFFNEFNLPQTGIKQPGVDETYTSAKNNGQILEWLDGKLYPKEFVIDVRKGRNIYFKPYVAQMGASAPEGRIILHWKKLNMNPVVSKDVLSEELKMVKNIKPGYKVKSAFDNLNNVVNEIKSRMDSINNEEEVKREMDKIKTALDVFNKSEDSEDVKIAKKIINDYKNLSIKNSIENSAKIKDIIDSSILRLESILDDKTMEFNEYIKNLHNVMNLISNVNYYNQNPLIIKGSNDIDEKGRLIDVKGNKIVIIKHALDISNLHIYSDKANKYKIKTSDIVINNTDPEKKYKMIALNMQDKLYGKYYLSYDKSGKHINNKSIEIKMPIIDTNEFNKAKFGFRRIINLDKYRTIIESKGLNFEEVKRKQSEIEDRITKSSAIVYSQKELNDLTKDIKIFLEELGVENIINTDLPTEEKYKYYPKIDEAKLKDGVYEGIGNGYEGGKTRVRIIIEEGKIKKLEILNHNDTPNIFDKARIILERMIGLKSKDEVSQIDVVTRATKSSEGIKSAVKDALEKAIDKSINKDNEVNTKPVDDTNSVDNTSNATGSDDKNIDKNVYLIPASIKKFSSDEDSMANRSLDKSRVIVRKDGRRLKIQIKFNPMVIGNDEGHITNLFILNPNEEQAKNLGNGVWEFILDNEQDIVDIKVWVDVMDALAGGVAGAGAQKAKLMLDFSKKTYLEDKEAKNIEKEIITNTTVVSNDINKMEVSPLKTLLDVNNMDEKTIEKLKEERNINEVVNIKGVDRYETSLNISKKYFKHADEVILVSGKNKIDSILSSSIAAEKKSPIILVDKMNLSIQNEIKRLGAKKIKIVGGEKSVGEDVVSRLKKQGLYVSRINGKDRYSTMKKINENIIKNSKYDKVLIVNSTKESDLVVASSYSAKYKTPILFSDSPDGIDKSMTDGKEVIIVGGNHSVDDRLISNLGASKIQRVDGRNRYETSIKLSKLGFENMKNIVLINGENMADSASVNNISYILDAPVILVNDKISQDIRKIVKESNKKNIVLVGGEKSISKNVKNYFLVR